MIKNVMIVIIITFSGLIFSQEYSDEKVTRIVQSIDELYRSSSSYSELEMEVVTPQWQRTLDMKAWTEGKEKTFIRITAPAKEQGVATLRIKNEMWNYLPKINKVIKIPPSMMMSSWMGSDFNNDDLVNEFSLISDYHYKLIHPADAADSLFYVECVPKPDLPIIWGKVVITVRKMDYIPVQEKYYDEKGNIMRVMNYKDIKIFDGRKIPAIMELIPQNKTGHKTVLKYLDAQFNIPLDKDIFSLRNLHASE